MLREQIKKDIEKEVVRLVGKWDGRVEVTRSSDERFGDYSTNVALKIGSSVKSQVSSKIKSDYQSPLEFAKKLADSLKDQPYIEKLEVKEPGFINFLIRREVWQKSIADVLKEADRFGSNNIGKGKKARVEFVSANPTGPLHFGNARGGPIGDALASILEFSGYKVLREYYHNDVGVQVEKLGQSIINIHRSGDLEDQEYKGEYVAELAGQVRNTKQETPNEKLNAKTAGAIAVKILLKEILKDCEDMGIKFDKVQVESELISSNKTKSALDFLQKKKALKMHEGATWFAPHDKWLEDRETVVVKSDGDFTYFANDIAYHRLKFSEKYDLVIDILGSNHHGHVPRLKAVIETLGFDIEKFKVILYQWVRFKRGEELVKMSKRSGTFVTTREVLDEVGKDALRFFILMHDAGSHIDFDLDLARERSTKNPVYYVQYAHARIYSILAKSEIRSTRFASRFWRTSPEAGKARRAKSERVNYGLLTSNYELNLIKEIIKLPELVEDITQSFAVNQLTTYSIQLADSFHKFYENVQVLTENKEMRQARLSLISAAQIVLVNVLELLGISAPKKM